jgi:hypothetical protein
VNPCAKLVNVDGVIAEVDALRLVYSDDKAILADIFDGVGLGDIDFDAGLQDGRGNHEDDEKHENHVHEGDHVDVREGSLRRFGESRHGQKLTADSLQPTAGKKSDSERSMSIWGPEKRPLPESWRLRIGEWSMRVLKDD